MSSKTGLYGLPEPSLPPRPPSRWRWVWRIAFGFLAVGILTVTVLTLLGGTGDSMRSSIENFIGDTTGTKVKIGTLNAASMFPVIGMDVTDMTMSDASGKVVGEFAHVNFSTGFWAALVGKSSLRSVVVKDGKIAAGILTPGALAIKQLGIDMQGEGAPRLMLDGSYDGKPMILAAGLERRIGLSGASSFTLRDNAPFTFTAGPVSLSGKIGTGKSGQRVLEIDTLSTGGKDTPITGQMDFFRQLNGFGAAGRLVMKTSDLKYDLSIYHENGVLTVEGDVKSDALDLQGLLGEKDSFVSHYETARGFYEAGNNAKRAAAPFDFSMTRANIAVDVATLSSGGFPLGPIKAPLTIENGVLQFGPVMGKIMAGKPDGLLTLDASKAPAALAVKFNVHGLDYTALTPALKRTADGKGDADIRVDLTSSGNNTTALLDGLAGSISVLAGQGELSDSIVSLWGGGLVNAMLPSFDSGDRFSLECGIADFKVKDGIAHSSVVFMDTKDVTVVGEGSINLPDLTINMKLEPKAKTPAFLSAATAVNLRGDLVKPVIRPDTFSLGKKLGGLFLGTINPAFLAISLTDLGSFDSHPCKAYIKP